jgi:hypothetical protein
MEFTSVKPICVQDNYRKKAVVGIGGPSSFGF